MGRVRGLKKSKPQVKKLTKLSYDGHIFYNEAALDLYKILEDFRLRHNYFRENR